MNYNRLFKLLFTFICLFTAASLISAALQAKLSGVIVYDSNFRAMHETLSLEEAAGITRSVRGIAAWCTWPLVASNLCWIALFLFCHSRTPGLIQRNA